MVGNKLQLNIKNTNPPIIHAVGELDYQNCESLSNLIQSTASDVGWNLKMDLDGLSYVDSSGIRVLAKAALSARSAGGDITILSLTHQLNRMLEITGFKSLFSVAAADFDSESSGKNNYRPKKPACCFELPAEVDSCVEIRNRVCDYAESVGCGSPMLEDIRLAVGEATSNAIRHGTCCGETINVKCQKVGDSLSVTLHYPSEQFSPDTVPLPDINLSPSGGMGIYFMRLLMDEVTYDFNDGYVSVTLAKRMTE